MEAVPQRPLRVLGRYSLGVPPLRPARQQRWLSFTAPDGRSEIRAYGHLTETGLIDDARQTEQFAAADRLHVTYRQANAHAFTLTGLKGDRIVYVHGVSTCKGVAAAILWADYPASEKDRFDPLIAHMAMTLHGSNACWSPG